MMLSLPAIADAAPPLVRNRSDVGFSGSANLGTAVVANNFVMTAPALVTFSGTPSWALYDDSLTPPTRPGSLFDSGTAAEVVADGSSVLRITGLGGPESYLYWDDDETAPGNWPFNFGLGPSPAFAITEELIFASGFEAGVTCAWSNGFEVDCI